MQHYFDLAKKLLTVHNTGVLKCMRINNGMCTVSNSKMSYIAFIPEFVEIDATVDARKFMAACEGASYEPKIKQTNNFLSISNGPFKARIATTSEPYPEIRVKGDFVDLDSETFNTLKKLQPFVSSDVSRPWSCSVLFDMQHAYASNNVIAARVRLVTPRKFSLPAFALTELLRASIDVVRVSMTDIAVRFELNNGVALQSSLGADEWPDVAYIIDSAKCDPPIVPQGMKKGVEALVPLCDNMSVPRINLSEDGMSTADGNSQARYTDYFFPRGAFHATPLLEVLKVASHVNFGSYPKPCYFKGPVVEGVLVGLR